MPKAATDWMRLSSLNTDSSLIRLFPTDWMWQMSLSEATTKHRSASSMLKLRTELLSRPTIAAYSNRMQ